MVLLYPIMPNVLNLNTNDHDGLLLLSWWTEKLEIEIPNLIVIQDKRSEGWLRVSLMLNEQESFTEIKTVFISWNKAQNKIC